MTKISLIFKVFNHIEDYTEEADPPNFNRTSSMEDLMQSLISDDDDEEVEGEEEEVLNAEDPEFDNPDYDEGDEEPEWPVERPKYVPKYTIYNTYILMKVNLNLNIYIDVIMN